MLREEPGKVVKDGKEADEDPTTNQDMHRALSFGSSLQRFASSPSRPSAVSTLGKVKVERRPTVESIPDGQLKQESEVRSNTAASRPKTRSMAKGPTLVPQSSAASGRSPVASSVKKSPKSKRSHKGYAPPEKYSHLPDLPDKLRPGLRCVFVGFNPGTMTALKGHSYAHPSNSFWKMLYQSGCVDRQVTYLEDGMLPEEYGIGFTDLVQRPTTGISELSTEEMAEGAHTLEAKLEAIGPGVIAMVGKGIWETIYKVKTGHAIGKKGSPAFEWGYQRDVGFDFASCKNIFVLPSTSGLVAGVPQAKKAQVWDELSAFLHEHFPHKTR